MKNKNRKPLLIATVLFLVFVLPLIVYLARTRQLFRPRAAVGQVTVNLVPLEVSKNIGEPFLVDVFASSGTIPLSGITVRLSGNSNTFLVQDVTGAVTATDAFTDLIYDKNTDPFSFTLLAKKPTAQLLSGSVKVASLSIVSYEPGTHTLGVDITQSEAVGFNGTSEDVQLTIAAGTQVSHTTVGSLCKLAQCVEAANMTTTPALRANNKYNVLLSFPTGNTPVNVYKIYRNIGASVPETHPDTNLIGVVAPTNATSQQFIDTNSGLGYDGETNLHYDMDAYTVCTAPTTTLTPSLTPTVIPTATPAG